MQFPLHVVKLVGSLRRSILVEALLTNALGQIASPAVYCHVAAAILAMSQCRVNVVLKTYELRKRERIQIRFHRIACKFCGLEQVLAGGGDDELHVSQRFLANRDLLFHC